VLVAWTSGAGTGASAIRVTRLSEVKKVGTGS
jgi:hypothetical protein